MLIITFFIATTKKPCIIYIFSFYYNPEQLASRIAFSKHYLAHEIIMMAGQG
jgi:hypothetical protein